MKQLLKLLHKYEKKHAPRLFPNGNVRFTHWYKLNLYTDGSGFVQDTFGGNKEDPQVKFRFDNLDELKKELLE